METRIYNNKQEVAEYFSKYLEQLITEKDKLSVALSGGSTPKVVFDHLSNHYAHLDWSKVHFFWGDERCVPPGHEESNYKMTVDHLLSNIDIPSENIHRIKGENDPLSEAKDYSEQLNGLLPIVQDIPQFDLVILGMGGDGHTASIFPHEIQLWDSDKLCEVAIHPDSGQKRITLTGQVINNAQQVAFLVTGGDKKEKVIEIMNHTELSRNYPASLVAPTSGKLLWFLDNAAADDS